MPLPSSGIIVVEKPSSASTARINNSTTIINTVKSAIHPPQEQTAQQQQTQIQYYEYYDVNENQLSQQYHQQQQQQHSTIVVDGTVYHHQQQQQQQQHPQQQLGGSSGVVIGRKVHNSSSTSSTSSSTSSSSSSTSSTLNNKPNLHTQTFKTVPMPQTKQYSQQQQIIQHTSHTTTATVTAANPQHHLHQQSQHVQQINLAASSIHHQTQHHHTQQQTAPTAHMIQVSEEFLEQAANNHNTANMMISATGEVINQQQIFKIVSTDGTTGNMIIDASNQNANATASSTPKVLLSNLTVLSKQQTTTQGQIIATNHQQPQNAGQTINFVNAKNLYTTSTGAANMAGGKQQKFTVATTNVGNYKGSSAIKQASSGIAANTQYIQQSNTIGQQKINMTTGNRNMQMLTTTRVQNAIGGNTTPSSNSSSNVAVISNNVAPTQTMVLQQQSQKFIANNTASGGVKSTTSLCSGGGNVIKKSATAGTLRMNNSNTTAATTKLMNNLQTVPGVKTFIPQTSGAQQQTQQNINQLTLHHHNTKGGGKSKFVKQYNNAILNSAGAVAIATLPHQQSNTQPNLQIQQQQQQQHQHQQLQPQTTYVNHHKSSGGGGSTKINKINSKYAQSSNVAAQLPPGTQLHQKSINQTQQQFQATSSSNSNIKFVNAQGTIIQQHQQSLTPQKINSKHHHQQQQQQYQNIQNFDSADGNHIYNHTSANSVAGGVNSTISGTTTSHSSTPAPTTSSLLTDDIMMVNGTQMTDELSARILQSMSQKSFSNQRYQQQQQQHVFQSKTTTSAPPPLSASSTPLSSSNNNNNNNNSNSSSMLPPPITAPLLQTNNNNSNILLSPREFTVYPATSSTVSVACQQQQQQSPPNHYNNSSNTTAMVSSNITAGSFSSNNYITVSNNNSNTTTITPHTSGTSAANGLMSNNTSVGITGSVRQAQSGPSSRSQSMERKLHESSMSRKSTEYYKVNLKDYHHSGCAFVVPTTGAIYATNTSASATSLIDFIIPLPSCTTITTTNTNNITTSTTSTTTKNCATMTTIITNSSYNHNHKLNQINNNSNHNSLRGSHHNNLVAVPPAVAGQSGGCLGMASGNMAASATNLFGGVVTPTPPSPSPLPMPRPPSIPSAAMIMEPQAQVIHLQATKTLPGANNSSNDDDDIIGEEIRPAPVETEDIRLRILHAVLFDHTYVNPMPLELPTSFAVQLPPVSNSNAATSSSALSSGATAGHSQQWSLGGIGAVAAVGSGSVSQQKYALYGTQLSRLQDDDSYSAISTSSRPAVGDIDPGEETETAPEAELEDDSVTRCICDLTHDDGYMICCDKCCAWQHVDCMGIDRQNIPDEYLCELCQPRAVDKARARSLQLMKRKEQQQQQQLMLTAQAQAAASAGTMGAAGSASGVSVGGVANLLQNDVLGAQNRLMGSSGAGYSLSGNVSSDSSTLQLLTPVGSNLKKGGKMLKKVKDGVTGKRSKKAEKLAAAAAAGLTVTGKPARKETKKNTKRKKAGAHEGIGSTVGMTAAEKHAANLRQWIENYELAVTNHYSPELRARLHAITKQPSLFQSILNTENPILKEFSNGSLENRATTVPHAGGKILISNSDITPNSPICELRGKYMLTTQYKTQNTSMNMNSPPPNNYHLTSYKAHKTPGPFIFFFQLPGTEMAAVSHNVPPTTTTTTLNPDGTSTTTTTTLPSQQSPPTFVKGPEICVDTRTYGNEARFVRRSCRPNAEIQHLFEKGTIHLFIVALTDIRASTEITIRHEPHDVLAVENKKSTTMIIQPTSTSCACGLTKDCLFGPPLPQLPPAAKSNAGRKSLTQGGGTTSNPGNLTAKQRKANQQNLNRNRSISSSASGDSNMGTTSTNTIAIGLNSPNNVGKATLNNKIVNNSTLMPLNASCNSNLSNASSTSSTLTSIMHDSGICTSSSSPSVSIPSPTQHMHSPIQQQQQVQQQQLLLHNNQMRSSVQLLPQQQQQQLMQSLPTPLILPTSADMSQHLQHLQPQQQQQLQQQQPVLQQPAIIIQQQQLQPLSVISQTTSTTLTTAQEVHTANEQQQPQIPLCMPIQQKTSQSEPPIAQIHQIQQQIILQEQQQQVQVQVPQHPVTAVPAPTGLLETVSPEATIAAVALQSLNVSHSPGVGVPAKSPAICANGEPQQIQQQQQFVLIPATGMNIEQQLQNTNQSSDNLLASTSVSSSVSSSPPQQHKSPQKNNHSHQNNTQPARKTPGKHGRTTSFSEDNEHQHHNDDNSVTSTPPSSSTPKEKPKLSREDRKMEAILRAIEKMERNQQRKQEQKQAKRQNSGSHNTTPTSPNKTFEAGENSGGNKRSNSHTGTGRSKRKRKAGAKGGQSGAYNNQRKRRQSRMNSQESVDECQPHDHDTITSESDGCAAMHSPPIQTMASLRQTTFSTPTTTNVVGCIASPSSRLPSETITNNVDQAAGLLMAFANPNISSNISSSVPTSVEQHVQQSPLRSSSQYLMSSNEAVASPPPTPPSHVSSACLLIEAAVGPLETNLDSNNAEMHNSEFKYPLQAKTKKHLMNNWLHQAEENTPNSTPSPIDPSPPTSQTTGTAIVCNNVSVVTGGLDSLLQAAMSDLKQTQADSEQPQNLSIVAQKVEEFIQQTEASTTVMTKTPENKHSYEYEQQQQRSFVNLPTPAVDLTLKTPLTIGPNPSTEVTTSNRNFHLPLQVSTCSNNSSVKKRWLRQAISEETHEEFHNSFSMTPSPTAAVICNTIANPQTQPAVICSPGTTVINHVPNGFTTPLKKRRLLLTGKDEMDENLSQSCGDLSANATPSPPPAPVVVQLPQLQPLLQPQVEFSPLKESTSLSNEFENKYLHQAHPTQDIQEDIDVDVEKCEINEVQLEQTKDQQQQLQYSKIEMDKDQNIDVTTSPQEHVAVLRENQIKIETVIKHENTEVKQESPRSSVQQTVTAEFNDQEDDVDILRSPSPGREMIKAEDNLVKIEPEDTSGAEDVKIDVEREEESMAADDVDVVNQQKDRKEEHIPVHVFKEDEKLPLLASSQNVEIKQEVKLEDDREKHDAVQEQHVNREIDVVETKTESNVDLQIKTEEESNADIEEPNAKRLKLEKSKTEEHKVCVKKEAAKLECSTGHVLIVKQEVKAKVDLHEKISPKQEVHAHSTIKESEQVLKTESAKLEKTAVNADVAEVSSSKSSSLLAVRTLAADTSFADVDATPPPPPSTTIVGVTAAPIQRHKSLSDDDIQARLHSFHKENILFLQSRNKKTKSSTAVSANANSGSSSSSSLATSNDHHKNRTSSSSSSSSNHQHHHNHHHHHHEGKEKSEKSSSKHHKSSSSTPSGSSKKQKLHKRERTTSTSSSNSHKNGSTPHISSCSSTNLLSKNAVINSTTNSSGSSKNLKSLKKSSSGSSTSSNTSSSSSYSSSNLSVQNCYPSSSTTANASSNSDKDKQQKQRTSSSSSGNTNVTSNPNTSAPMPYTSSKKRQLNFELELTKDMHLLNSVTSGGGKHKREAARLASEEQSHVPAKKSKKETSSFQKEELKNGANKQLAKIEKQQDKNNKGSNVANATPKVPVMPSSTSTKSDTALATNTSSISAPSAVSTTFTPTITEEPKQIPTIVTQPAFPSVTPILREHPTLPHFNNVVIATTSSLGSHQQPLTHPPVQSQSPHLVLPQNIPNHVNTPSFIAAVHNQPQSQQPPLPHTPPPGSGLSSPLTTPNANTNHLPFYNTIYGKLLDNPAPNASLPTPMTPSNTTTPPQIATPSGAVATGSSVLSEYLDTKLKSYSSLGGYVSHTALFGLNNVTSIKDPSVVSSTTMATAGSAVAPLKDSSAEMPAPLAPPPNASSSSSTLASTCPNTSGSSVTTLTTPLKILTKTASHDPRLNPQLTAPEPPPQPKRKLSINEYRKRMQQSSSNDSNNGSGGSLTTTPTTPPTLLDTMLSSSPLATTTVPLNKCTLNSPDRLTQSIDSQIQKEIMSSSTTAVTSSSSLDSLNSSNSSTSSNSLNDTLLKSSSFVEEDSTKGQFNAAPTLLEKQQESLCARLKSLKEKQSLGTSFGTGNRSRFSSFSETVASSEFILRKDDDDLDIIRNRNHSISSSIGGGDLLDNCLEEISSTSTSMSSSREPSPERCYTTHKILTASATTTLSNTSATSHNNNGQPTTRHHQIQQHHHTTTHHVQQPPTPQHINCDKNDTSGLERKKSVDIA